MGRPGGELELAMALWWRTAGLQALCAYIHSVLGRGLCPDPAQQVGGWVRGAGHAILEAPLTVAGLFSSSTPALQPDCSLAWSHPGLNLHTP